MAGIIPRRWTGHRHSLQIIEEECKLKENMGALKRPDLEM